MLLKMQVIGNLGRDASLKDFNGKKVLNFSVAHTEKFKNRDGVVTEKTTWVECSMWDKEGLAPYLKQGQLVHLDGTPSVNAFETKEGKPAASLRLAVFGLQLLGGKKEDGKHAPSPTASVPVAHAAPVGNPDDDDLPF